jgi:signal transduction histidine kinase
VKGGALGLQERLRRWALAAAGSMAGAALLCLAFLAVLWQGQTARIRKDLDLYARQEAMGVARLLLFDMASDPRVLQVHQLEASLQSAAQAPAGAEGPPDETLLELVRREIDWPDTQIWMAAVKQGLPVTLAQVSRARATIYREALDSIATQLQEDLWARVTFSEQVRGVRMVSTGGLVRLAAGEDPPEEAQAEGQNPRVLSSSRLLVVLPLYVQSRRWGTAAILVDRSFLAQVVSDLTGTVELGLWAMVGLLLALLATWAGWWAVLGRAVRREVVAPVVELARRMDEHAQEPPLGGEKVSEPQQLAVAFDRLLVRIEEQKEQLLRAQRLGLMERVGAGLSHELNNALNPARLRLEEMELDGRPPSAEDARALKEYLTGALRILKDFALAARPSPGPPLRLAPEEWLDVARRLVEPHADRAGTTLSWEIEQPPPRVLGDRQALVQAAANLLLNAVEAVEEKGAEGRVEVSLRAEGGRVLLTVADNGPGVPPEVAAHLFEPFVTSKARGTGLGLFVVDALARRMGGSARVQRRPEGGTEAILEMPRASEGENHARA